ncbi:hypothetical protein PG993_009137 [Apiospora rasikravindrae]|uniref:Uncharacterized protein n=1 Tax=Apiospora rasikravindrae TaxID=990691 RepID=A0ABR1SIJ9_9PEZI
MGRGRSPPTSSPSKPIQHHGVRRRPPNAESRQAVLDVLPDILTFQILPAVWGDKDRPYDRGDGSGFPSYALRFNGATDIILFRVNWTDLDAAVVIAKMFAGGVFGRAPKHPFGQCATRRPRKCGHCCRAGATPGALSPSRSSAATSRTGTRWFRKTNSR